MPKSWPPVLRCPGCVQCFFAVKFYLPEFWIWFGQFLFGFLNFSEEGLAFGASSSIFCCSSGNGLSFEYVGLRYCGGLCGNSNSTFICYFLREV